MTTLTQSRYQGLQVATLQQGASQEINSNTKGGPETAFGETNKIEVLNEGKGILSKKRSRPIKSILISSSP